MALDMRDAIERAQELIALDPPPDDAEAQLKELLPDIPEFMHEDLWEGFSTHAASLGHYEDEPELISPELTS